MPGIKTLNIDSHKFASINAFLDNFPVLEKPIENFCLNCGVNPKSMINGSQYCNTDYHFKIKAKSLSPFGKYNKLIPAGKNKRNV